MAGLADVASLVSSRFVTNISGSFGSLTLQQWIRVVVIAGAYMLLRPYLIKLGGRFQMKQHEADERASAEEAAAIAEGKQAPLSANDLRGGAAKKAPQPESDPDDSEDDLPNAVASSTDWGKKARKRQRKILRTMLEQHEQQLADAQADDEDKDIEEFLVD